MPTEKEIRDYYQAQHDDLTHRYYVLKELSKETFDTLHGQCWEAMKNELLAGGYISPPVEFPPDQARVAELTTTSPDVITMPEVWELLRIYAKALGYPPV